MKKYIFLFFVFYSFFSHAETLDPSTIVQAARRQIGVTTEYDPSYVVLTYPNGDVAKEKGVCTDVVIRALRIVGLDLQKVVHDDMRKHFEKYPHLWSLEKPDKNIDHRRVPNLVTFFKRRGWEMVVTKNAEDYKAGDIVTWKLPAGLDHIGIVSDQRSSFLNTPLVIHNIGAGTQEEDVLFQYEIVGHYRINSL